MAQVPVKLSPLAQVRIEKERNIRDVLRNDLADRRELIDLYNKVEECAKMDVFIRKDVFTAFPEFLKQAEKAKTDLNQKGSPLLVIGETSAGKSSFLNLLLGREILPESALPSTHCLCYLRYGDSLEAEVTTLDGVTLNIPAVRDEEDEEFQAKLEELVNPSDETDRANRVVNIYVPCDLLKGSDVFLVDTPGIDDKNVVTDLIVRYLTSAVGVVFVLNPTVNYGMAEDRGPVILEIIKTLICNNELQSFDPRKMLFLVNKWDQIKKPKDRKDIIETIRKKLQTRFPEWFHKGANILHMSVWEIAKVTKEDTIPPEFERVSGEYKAVLQAMSDLIRSCSVARTTHHTGMMRKLMHHFQESLAMIEAYEREEDKDTKVKKISVCDKILQELNDLFKQADKEVMEEIQQVQELIGKEAHRYIHNSENRDRIFDWQGRYPDGRHIDEIEHNTKMAIRQFIEITIYSFIEKHKSKIQEIKKHCQAHIQKMEEKREMFRAIFIDQEVEHDKGLSPRKGKESPPSRASVTDVVVNSPLWFPLGLLIAPALLGTVVVTAIHNKVKLLEYRSSKKTIVNQWTKALIEEVSEMYVESQIRRQISQDVLKDLRDVHHCICSYKVRVANLDEAANNSVTRAAFGRMNCLAQDLNRRLENRRDVNGQPITED